MEKITHASHLIDALGGTKAVADICEVSSQAVSQWRADGIPKARLKFLKLIRPDVDWDLLRNSKKVEA